jgi:hypothetical protein
MVSFSQGEFTRKNTSREGEFSYSVHPQCRNQVAGVCRRLLPFALIRKAPPGGGMHYPAPASHTPIRRTISKKIISQKWDDLFLPESYIAW